jgi:hypothetical protein
LECTFQNLHKQASNKINEPYFTEQNLHRMIIGESIIYNMFYLSTLGGTQAGDGLMALRERASSPLDMGDMSKSVGLMYLLHHEMVIKTST